MTGSSGFGNLGHGLVLSGADTVLKASFAAIQQAVEHFDLFDGRGWPRCFCQKRASASTRSIRARACSRLFGITTNGTEHAEQAPLSLSAGAQQRGECIDLPTEVRPIGCCQIQPGSFMGLLVCEPISEVIRPIW